MQIDLGTDFINNFRGLSSQFRNHNQTDSEKDAHQETLLKNYKKPTKEQVGYLCDVKVGHIDHFKFYEEF